MQGVCEQSVWAAGCWDHRQVLQEDQGSVLTNQCLGEKTNAEQGAEESSPKIDANFILEGLRGHTFASPGPHDEKLLRETKRAKLVVIRYRH